MLWNDFPYNELFVVTTGTNSQGWVVCLGTRIGVNFGSYIALKTYGTPEIKFHYNSNGTWNSKAL